MGAAYMFNLGASEMGIKRDVKHANTAKTGTET